MQYTSVSLMVENISFDNFFFYILSGILYIVLKV